MSSETLVGIANLVGMTSCFMIVLVPFRTSLPVHKRSG